MNARVQSSKCSSFSLANATCSLSSSVPQKVFPVLGKSSITKPVAFRPRTINHGVRSTKTVTQAIFAQESTTAPQAYLFSPPVWSEFEFGSTPVFWEPADPTPGTIMTVWFNPERTSLKGSYVGFNGGFNGPFMCGGSPRRMAPKSRGEAATPLYSVRVNVPKFASFLEFGFTDGSNWVEGYVVKVKQPKGMEGRSIEFFNDGLEKEMGYEGACEAAIFPDPAPEADRCALPAGIGLVGQFCSLDIVPGCSDPDASNYDPLANSMDGGSCDFSI
mmetsp:Transcript_39960/g.55551  ORF Transcript_39960/g.55551 Transcript_39960/m.55551 type:complete len:274 (-) Transcript_39960:129-950(-)|eukprot:CAMPEP_0196582550 /NCGR_PEP_ID=MMETSP1081-20130531/39453_1 /TAXON_ID=36882 /ORGANISM="Pyramimonas amylifera, Strain CCMP720" /LENGTH=273 /DNA_ID=CAMNT_0041903151 /DNA_START=85 /DNA_END=906 /DNA_ORIENTATION=+